MYEKIKFFIIAVLFMFILGCRTTVLSDNGTGVIEYREIESEIRDGETGLAVTSERISNDSSDLKETSEQLGNELDRIEQSIRESKSNEQELGEILQQIRAREIPGNKLVELGIISKE